MKNTIILFTIALSIALIGYNYINIKENIKIYDKQKAHQNTGFFDIGLKFYLSKNKYPKSIKEYTKWVEPDSFGLEYFKRELIDPFLRNGQILHYYPLYADTTQNPIACIFISVGEDGIFNNEIKGKLLLKDWYKYIKAYNIEDIKVELNKVEVRYPIYDNKGNINRYYIKSAKNEDISNGTIFIKGDTLFKNDNKLQNIEDKFSSKRPFFYPEFSISRKLFGKKDYIVNWGCRVIEYEIIK